jgi:hypothetical protein
MVKSDATLTFTQGDIAEIVHNELKKEQVCIGTD